MQIQTTATATRTPFATRTFILLVTYVAPLDRIDELLEEHRTWLDEHFADGSFLVSGPQVPRTGGAILATETSRRRVDDLVSTDPLVRANAAVYEVVEFTPTRGPYAASGPMTPSSAPTSPPPSKGA